MKSKYIISLAFAALSMSSCGDFLTREPEDTVTDIPSFWNNEDNIRSSVYNLYTDYFVGYNSGWSRSDFFYDTRVADWNDDNAQEKATMFTKVAPNHSRRSQRRQPRLAMGLHQRDHHQQAP